MKHFVWSDVQCFNIVYSKHNNSFLTLADKQEILSVAFSGAYIQWRRFGFIFAWDIFLSYVQNNLRIFYPNFFPWFKQIFTLFLINRNLDMLDLQENVTSK